MCLHPWGALPSRPPPALLACTGVPLSLPLQNGARPCHPPSLRAIIGRGTWDGPPRRNKHGGGGGGEAPPSSCFFTLPKSARDPPQPHPPQACCSPANEHAWQRHPKHVYSKARARCIGSACLLPASWRPWWGLRPEKHPGMHWGGGGGSEGTSGRPTESPSPVPPCKGSGQRSEGLGVERKVVPAAQVDPPKRGGGEEWEAPPHPRRSGGRTPNGAGCG